MILTFLLLTGSCKQRNAKVISRRRSIERNLVVSFPKNVRGRLFAEKPWKGESKIPSEKAPAGFYLVTRPAWTSFLNNEADGMRNETDADVV
jgi:hypothetical protein